MTPRPALSTPRPLPRKRENAKSRAAIKLVSVNGTSMQSNCNGLTPAKTIQKDEARLVRRKPIQTNAALADTQEARIWAATAGITLETGLMQLARAVPDAPDEALKNLGARA